VCTHGHTKRGVDQAIVGLFHQQTGMQDQQLFAAARLSDFI
jgi:hypothetical protein